MAQGARSRLSRRLDRQVKAAEREADRLRQAARDVWRQVKQRQISRMRERNGKHEPREFVREPGYHVEDEDDHRPLHDPESWRRLDYDVSVICTRRYDDDSSEWWNINRKGWKVVAVYRSRAGGSWGGRFLAYNILREDVLLSEYSLSTGEWGYCRECGMYRCHHPKDNIGEILKMPYRNLSLMLSRKEAFLVPASTFLVVAQRFRVPGMKRRRLQPEDVGYLSLVTLYATYTVFHLKVVQSRPSWMWPSRRAVEALATWRPREWTRRRFKALVHVQAMWRGWLFRHRVLYSPHTELGRRYLLRAWHGDLEQYLPT